MAKAQYQCGCLTLRKRSKGPDMWQWRWWEFDSTGKRVQRSRLIGTVDEYPTAKAAQPAVDAIRLEINEDMPKAVPVTVATLIDRYLNDAVEMGRLAYSTKQSYQSHLNVHVREHWGSFLLPEVRPMAVERWFMSLSLAPRTKVHIRNLMHVLFQCAARWELIETNPITLVRQGGQRLKDPDILTVQEFHSLLRELSSEGKWRKGLSERQCYVKDFSYARARTMAILAVCLGLSRSEFTGLKWSDFDWKNEILTIQRGVVNNQVGDPKTRQRRKPIPIAKEVIAVLDEWRAITPYRSDTDWVFASDYQKEKGDDRVRMPFSPDSVLEWVVKPAAKAAGITKQIGWHALRHTYSCLLRENGTDIKVQQELMRHSTVNMTLDVYTQAVSAQKRAANDAVVGQLLKATVGAGASA